MQAAVGLPQFDGHECWSAYNVDELFGAALYEWIARTVVLSACGSRAIEICHALRGEQRDEVLRDLLGYDDSRIAELHADAAFGQAA